MNGSCFVRQVLCGGTDGPPVVTPSGMREGLSWDRHVIQDVSIRRKVVEIEVKIEIKKRLH